MFTNRINYIAAFLLFFLLNACNDDKGNYDYIELNDIEFKNIEEEYVVNLEDVLEISPVLEFAHGKALNDLSYEWHLLGLRKNTTETFDSRRLLSTEPDLSLFIDPSGDMAKAGRYNFIFRVEDKSTGIKYSWPFIIEVQQNIFANGFLALCEKNGGFDIDMVVNYDGEYSFYEEMLDRFGSDLPRTGRPLDIFTMPRDLLAPCVNEAGLGNKRASVFVLTDQGTNRLRYEDFYYQPEYNISDIITINALNQHYLPDPIYADKIVSTASSSSAARAYFYINDNWFFYNFYTCYYMISSPINRYYTDGGFTESFKAAPYIYMNLHHGAILFNEDKNRFVLQKALTASNQIYHSSNVLCCRDELGEGPYFNWANPDYRLVYMGARLASGGGASHDGYAIVKNVSTNKYELLQFGMTSSMSAVTVTQKSRFDFGSLPDIEEAKFFAYRMGLSYIYYATETKAYRVLIDETADVLNAVDITDEVITDNYSRISEFKYVLPFGSTALCVGMYDPNGETGKNGKISFYKSDGISGILSPATYNKKVRDEEGNPIMEKDEDGNETAKVVETEMIWTGLGKIIGVAYKSAL